MTRMLQTNKTKGDKSDMGDSAQESDDEIIEEADRCGSSTRS